MDFVTVKNKFQIVIPQHVREQMHVEIGDILEAGVENGKIVFTPKSLIDRHLAEGLEDARGQNPWALRQRRGGGFRPGTPRQTHAQKRRT